MGNTTAGADVAGGGCAAAPSAPLPLSVPAGVGVSGGDNRPAAASPRITSGASPICGTHLALTNDVASMDVNPAAARRAMRSILVAVGTMAFSFCSPSLGPTSTIRTRLGMAVGGGGAVENADARVLWCLTKPAPAEAHDVPPLCATAPTCVLKTGRAEPPARQARKLPTRAPGHWAANARSTQAFTHPASSPRNAQARLSAIHEIEIPGLSRAVGVKSVSEQVAVVWAGTHRGRKISCTRDRSVLNTTGGSRAACAMAAVTAFKPTSQRHEVSRLCPCRGFVTPSHTPTRHARRSANS